MAHPLVPPTPSESDSWNPRPHLCAPEDLLPCDLCDGWPEDQVCPMCGGTKKYDPNPNFMDFWLCMVLWGQADEDRVIQIPFGELVETYGDEALPSWLMLTGKGMVNDIGGDRYQFDGEPSLTKRPDIWERDRQAFLAAMPYQDYLQTDHWRKTARAAKERAGFRCALCNERGQLHAHHRTYERRGAEIETDVIALCADCHRNFHKFKRVR